MGSRDDSQRTPFGVTSKSVTNVLFHSLCFVTVCVHNAVIAETRALSHPSPDKPMIYIDIPSWENRTAYPRFLVYRDHIRRRLENGDSSDSKESSLYPNFSKSSNASRNEESVIIPIVEKFSLKESRSAETDKNNEFSSMEQLLSLQRPRIDNANQNDIPNDPATHNVNANNFTPTTAHEKQIINFPKDKTNPCNRLQINPDEEQHAKQENATSMSSSSGSSEEVSLELENRQNFPGGHHQDQDDEHHVDLIKNAVPTFDLTMKIIEQSRWNEENAVFSPLSIANVLSMLLLGAGGETWKELSMQLDKFQGNFTKMSSSASSTESQSSSSDSLRLYHEAFKRLLVYLRKYSGEGVVLNSASEIFVDKSFPIITTFQQELMNFYEAPIEKVDFGMDGIAFMDRLNKWVREKTQNQIQTILDEPPPPTTTMGIVNAIHFKGPWDTAFNTKLTRWRDFRVQPGEKLKREMMINILEIPYVEKATYKMTAVPYKGNETALFLILPKGHNGINDLKNVEKILSRQELNDSIALMKEKKLAITLPKLKFSSDGEMVRILQNMGVSSIFNNANFSGISPEKGIYISRLFHRAVVEINEKGTEASAVSFGTADRIIDDPPVPFACDKPFTFFIYHMKADTILFWGRVVRPENDQKFYQISKQLN